MAELILGGARSGKSRLAQERALAAATPVSVIATAQAGDAHMRARIALHRAQRPAGWSTVEEPLQLAPALIAHCTAGRCVVVDCLTLWLSNLMFEGRAAAQAEAGAPIDCALLARETDALVDALPMLPGRVILVSNEVGWGVMPANALARAFADEQGRLNQRVAAACARVTLAVAGLPLELK